MIEVSKRLSRGWICIRNSLIISLSIYLIQMPVLATNSCHLETFHRRDTWECSEDTASGFSIVCLPTTLLRAAAEEVERNTSKSPSSATRARLLGAILYELSL